MKVQNKVIVITGAGSGMGRELVLQALSRGAKVLAVDINPASLKETVSLAGSSREAVGDFVADITQKDAVESLLRFALDRFGAVDGLINNAGIIQPFVRLNELGFEAIERVIKVNLYGTLYPTKIFLPHLLTRPEAHIVNISSMGGFLPVPGQTLYGATKAAVKLLTEGLHSELRDSRVHVTVVFPGAVQTNIARNSGITAMPGSGAGDSSVKSLPAKKAAEMILDGMERNAYRVLVGSDAKFMDFIYRLNPAYAAKFIYKKMKALLPA